MILSRRQKDILAGFQATIIDNPYIPHRPTLKQAQFLLFPDAKEGFYGGAARGGKSEALLMAALQYVTEPDYAALILRRTFPQLKMEDAIMDRAERWLAPTDAKWEGTERRWRFPSGATLTFGFLDKERDKYRFQSAAFQYIAFDELSQFIKSQYTYLFSRLTRLEGSNIPLRMRAAGNPGDVGHIFVKERFIIPTRAEMKARGRFFVPALLEDNPHVDQPAYEDSLIELDPVTYEQLRHGNWDIEVKGNMFKREDFRVGSPSANKGTQIRFWDMAATESGGDFTVGALILHQGGRYFIKNIVRFQKAPAESEQVVQDTAKLDGKETIICMEKEGGSSGAIAISNYERNVLGGYQFSGIPSTGSKVLRASPFSAAVGHGLVSVTPTCPWSEDMLYELVAFPTRGIHDDIVDALSGAYNELKRIDMEKEDRHQPLHSLPYHSSRNMRGLSKSTRRS